jgi:hypothetical protein
VPSGARTGAAALSIEHIHAAILRVAAGANESPIWGRRGLPARYRMPKVIRTSRAHTSAGKPRMVSLR